MPSPLIHTNMTNKEWRNTIDNVDSRSSMGYLDTFLNIARNSDNVDRSDAALATSLQLIMRDEDFRRSAPSAQVERLMAAGMSRSAALQAVQAQDYGSAETPIAGNVEQSKAETANAITNAVVNGLQLVEQVVNLGMQMGLAQSTIAVNAVQTQLYEAEKRQIELSNGFARLQYDSLTDVAMFMQAAHNYESRTGVRLPDSWDDALAAMQKVAYEVMPDVSSLANDRYKKALENPYFYPTMLQQWRDKRRNDYDIANERKRATAEANFAELNVVKLNEEIINARQEYMLYQAQIDELKAREQLERQESYTEGEKRNNLASQAALWHEQYSRLYLENQEYMMTDPITGKSYLRQRVEGESKVSYYQGCLAALDYKVQSESVAPLQQYLAMKELKSWQNTPDSYWQNKRDILMKDIENQKLALDVLSMSLSNNEEFRKKFPNLTTLFDLFDTYGIFDAALRSATAVGASSVLGTSNVAGAAAGAAIRSGNTITNNYTVGY